MSYPRRRVSICRAYSRPFKSIALDVIGSVIPAQDYQFLYDHGAAAIFGPGTVIPIAAPKVLQELQQRLGH